EALLGRQLVVPRHSRPRSTVPACQVAPKGRLPHSIDGPVALVLLAGLGKREVLAVGGVERGREHRQRSRTLHEPFALFRLQRVGHEEGKPRGSGLDKVTAEDKSMRMVARTKSPRAKARGKAGAKVDP